MLQIGWKLTSGYGFEYKLVFNATYGVEKIEFKIWFSFTPHTGRTGKWLQEREKTPTTALPENRQKRKFHFHCQPKISSNQLNQSSSHNNWIKLLNFSRLNVNVNRIKLRNNLIHCRFHFRFYLVKLSCQWTRCPVHRSRKEFYSFSMIKHENNTQNNF